MTDIAQHGRDYLTDWYALLGVPRTADAETIRSAYKQLMLQYHPDRYAHLAPEFHDRAEQKSRLITEASNTLLDTSRRAAYDAQLAAWTGPVSDDGRPIINLSSPYFAPSALLEGDDAAARKKAREQALTFSGFDEKSFTLVERMARMPDAAPDVIDAYREALRRKSVFVELEEALLWNAAGFKNRPHEQFAGRDYAATVAGALAAGREEARGELSGALLALEGREVRRLGPGGEERVETLDQAAIVKSRDEALGRFDAIADAIREKARERETLVGNRIDLVAGEYRPEQPQRFPRLLVRLRAGDSGGWFAFLVRDGAVSIDNAVSEDDMVPLDNPGKAAEWIARGYNVMFIDAEEGVDLRAQLETAVIRHFSSLD